MYVLARPTGEPGIAWAATLLASRSAANYNIQVAVWADDDGALLCTTTPPTRPHAPLLIYKLLGST